MQHISNRALASKRLGNTEPTRKSLKVNALFIYDQQTIY